VFGLGPATRIYVALGATDMRKGFDGLHEIVRDKLGLEVRTGHLFLFANARRNRLKILYWDGSGLWSCATLTLWQRLTRFLDYPVLELSNNLAENAIRPVALGRRSWIHVGSKEAGPRVAAIISVVETCRRLKIPVRDYLGSVLPGLGDFPVSRIAELTPAAWATRN
jgi:transposase